MTREYIILHRLLLKQPRARHPRRVKLARIWLGRLREPLLTILLTVQIFILFALPTARALGVPLPHVAVYGVLLAFVILAALLSRSRTAIIMMVCSVALTIIGSVWRQAHPGLTPEAVSTAGQVLVQLSLLWAVSSAVFGGGRATHHRILGAVVMYLSIGMIFLNLDLLLARILPNAFTHLPTLDFDLRETMTYFSFSTLTTGNFGDIVPVHPVARSLANLESICGQLFPATLLARIVSLHGERRRGK